MITESPFQRADREPNWKPNLIDIRNSLDVLLMSGAFCPETIVAATRLVEQAIIEDPNGRADSPAWWNLVTAHHEAMKEAEQIEQA